MTSFSGVATMQTDNRFFDDLSRMAGGALNALTGLKTEVEAIVRQQLEHFISTLHLVTREEFETIEALAAKARDEQEALVARLDALEAQLAAIKGQGVSKGVRKAKSAASDEKA
jgi:BMFP domain-containing protein YqiC